MKDNPWPDDVEFPCEKKLFAAIVGTVVAMWRHRRELPGLWREMKTGVSR